MTDRAMLTIMTAIIDWKCPGHLYGTGALMVCANEAIEHERRGSPWNAFRLAERYATRNGKVQHSVWVSICYALKHGTGPKSPAEAIKAIVKRAYNNGTIDKVREPR